MFRSGARSGHLSGQAQFSPCFPRSGIAVLRAGCGRLFGTRLARDRGRQREGMGCTASSRSSSPRPSSERPRARDSGRLICRWHGRLVGFWSGARSPARSGLSAPEVEALIEERLAFDILRMRAADALSRTGTRVSAAACGVSLSIAICTKDRAQRLERLLVSLDRVVPTSRFESLEILGDRQRFGDDRRKVAVSVRSVRLRPRAARRSRLRPQPGHARGATGRCVAYLDDDVVVDHNWLWRDAPGLGRKSRRGMRHRTRPAMALDSEAQIVFEIAAVFAAASAPSDSPPSATGRSITPAAPAASERAATWRRRDLILRARRLRRSARHRPAVAGRRRPRHVLPRPELGRDDDVRAA